MAIMRTSKEFWEDKECRNMCIRAFDFIEKLKEEGDNTFVFRVLNDEVPKEDIQISFVAERFEGVKNPVITKYEIY